MALSKITNSGIGAIDTLSVDTDTLVVDSTNNRVGIGTASPANSLHVTASISGDDLVYLNNINPTASDVLRLNTAGDGSGTNILDVQSDGTTRFLVIGDGNVLVGKTATSTATEGVVLGAAVELTSFNRAGAAVIRVRRETNAGDALEFYNGTTKSGSISVNGSSTAYNTSSDYRLKENVTDITDATTRLKQLNPVRFNFIDDADITVDGFLAHEVQSVVPEAINGTHNEVDDNGNPVYQGIDQSKLVPLLVKTIQELEARIVTLENA
jgi:hypothetical protein